MSGMSDDLELVAQRMAALAEAAPPPHDAWVRKAAQRMAEQSAELDRLRATNAALVKALGDMRCVFIAVISNPKVDAVLWGSTLFDAAEEAIKDARAALTPTEPEIGGRGASVLGRATE